VSPEKKAEPIEMPFGVGTQVGPRNNLLGGPGPPIGMGNYEERSGPL